MTKLICLMPTYNKAETLAQAIQSVMMQKTNFEYKLLILDDGSTDNSISIAQNYQMRYPDKIEIHQNRTNLKLLKTMMNSYKLLKGATYFCVLDADDYYTYDKKFQEAVDFLDNHPDYTMYLTNIVKKDSTHEELYYKGKIKSYNFNYNDRKYGTFFALQTSGIIYRNIFFKDGENQDFSQITNLFYPESFRADGFRFEWYLQHGKAHFENHPESVYNYNQQGIWSSLSQGEQDLTQALAYCSYADFFLPQRKYYLSLARQYYRQARTNFIKEDSSHFIRNSERLYLINKFLTEHTPERTLLQRVLKIIITFLPFKKLRKFIRIKLDIH